MPALRHGPTWSSYESAVLLEYLEDLCPGLLPAAAGSAGTDDARAEAQAQARADARRWADHVNRSVGPACDRALHAQDPDDQATLLAELLDKIQALVKEADPEGPFFAGRTFGWVDAYFAPWIIRFRLVLTPYRSWPEPEPGSRWERWVTAVETHPAVRATSSSAERYFDAYRRYAGERAP